MISNKNIFHILNGDALKDRFPNNINGYQIVMRECLVDGPVNDSMNLKSLSKFYDTRSSFLFENYQVEKSIYHNTSMSETERMLAIPTDAHVYLWFEDDLFCQINMWFLCHLLSDKNAVMTSLVRPTLAYSGDLPETALQYGFGGLDTALLNTAFEHSMEISNADLKFFAQLWNAFQSTNERKLLEIADILSPHFDFILDAANACIDLWNGRPTLLLQQIVEELKTDNFGQIFQTFCERGAVYGFGDLQVRRLLELGFED